MIRYMQVLTYISIQRIIHGFVTTARRKRGAHKESYFSSTCQQLQNLLPASTTKPSELVFISPINRTITTYLGKVTIVFLTID